MLAEEILLRRHLGVSIMRAIQVKIRRGKDNRWYSIIQASNGDIMWVTPGGYARTHHAKKSVLTIVRAFWSGKFTITIAKTTRKDQSAVDGAKQATRRVK